MSRRSTLLLLLLLLLFVFNIYVLAFVITVISSVMQVIINDQRLTEYSRLYISNTFLSILAVPSKAVFCIAPTLHVMSSFSIHLSNSEERFPRAPITTSNRPCHIFTSSFCCDCFLKCCFVFLLFFCKIKFCRNVLEIIIHNSMPESIFWRVEWLERKFNQFLASGDAILSVIFN